MHKCLRLSLLDDNQVFVKHFNLELNGLNVIASDKSLLTLAKVAISRRDYYLVQTQVHKCVASLQSSII